MSATADKPDSARTTALSLNIKDTTILHAAYMGYVKGGGMFIPTNRPYRMGDEIFLLISLMGEANRIPVAGKVVWVTPAGSQGSKVQGVGVQFKDDEGGKLARTRIEALLAGLGKLARPTHTM